MSRGLIGILIGIVIGVVFVSLGALNAFFVALIILAFWLIAKIVGGEIDVIDVYDRLTQSRPPRRR